VPKQKINMIKAELIGVAEARARDWVVKVKPQGRKKVRMPAIIGEVDLILRLLKEIIFKKFKDKIRVIIETIRLVMAMF